MDIRIYPNKLSGTVLAIPSKSQAHRVLICAAFADAPTEIYCPQTNDDIQATVECLRAMGAVITENEDGFRVIPIRELPQKAELYCRESGSTLRFLLPIIGALGIEGRFYLEGRLPYRPLSPLWEEMERMGCTLTKSEHSIVRCTGKLRSGHYRISGSISSQYITGLLFALSMLPGESTLELTGKTESVSYITMTKAALNLFGATVSGWKIPCSVPFHSPGNITVEGDWSNAAFFLAAGSMGSPLTVTGLSPNSSQGDRVVVSCLEKLQHFTEIDAANIPDLIPILAVVAAAKQGAVFQNIRRLRLKESDRVQSVIRMLEGFGIRAEATEETLHVFPGIFHSGTVDAVGDHRIAMAAAMAATIADGPVTILGAQCVSKSYPSFWEAYKQAGGQYEQYIR